MRFPDQALNDVGPARDVRMSAPLIVELLQGADVERDGNNVFHLNGPFDFVAGAF